MGIIMGNMSNLDMDRDEEYRHNEEHGEGEEKQTIFVVSDDPLRECVNDLIVVIASMQEKIHKIEDKLEELL